MNAKPRAFSFWNARDVATVLKMLLPLVFIVGTGIHFRGFVVHAIETNVAINMGIILAASYAVVLIITRLIGAQRDFRTIERFGHEASQGAYMKGLLEEPWLKKRYVRHYLSHIANTGGTLSSQMDQSAIENELHALQGEYDSRLELPQFFVGFMIAMGLLGTFIGLLETLTGISGMLDGMGSSGEVEQQFVKLVAELRKPLAGMGIAFSASMFGLITSLMLAIMMTNLRRYISRVIMLSRNVMHQLLERAREVEPTNPKSLSPEDVDAMLHGNNPNRGSRGPQTGLLSMLIGHYDVMARKIDTLLSSIESNISSTQKMVDLLGFGPRIKEINEGMLEEIRILVSKQIDSQQILQMLLNLGQDNGRSLSAMVEAQRHMNTNGESSLTTLKEVSAGLAQQRQILSQQTDYERAISDNLSKTLEGQQQARAELDSGVQKIAELLRKIETAHIGSAKNLYEIKEKFTKISETDASVSAIAAGVAGYGALLESILDAAQSSQNTLDAIYREAGKQTP